MSEIERAGAEKIRELQALEVFAGKYCKQQLDLLFMNDIKSKGSSDHVPAEHAQVYRNNMNYVLDRVMSLSLLANTTVTSEPVEFMEEYDRRRVLIIERYEAIQQEEEEIARRATAAAAAMAEEATGRQLSKGNIRSYFSRKGGRRRRKTART